MACEGWVPVPSGRGNSSSTVRLLPAPITLRDANLFVQRIHRHNGALPSAKLAVAAIDTTGLVHGVAIAGLPKARLLMQAGTLEVNRVCTDGTQNACTFLYGAIKRAAKALGYSRLITYTHQDEPGTSLKASGWSCDGKAGGGSWVSNDPRRATSRLSDNGIKQRWSIVLADDVPELVLPDEVREQLPPTLWDTHDDA